MSQKTMFIYYSRGSMLSDVALDINNPAYNRKYNESAPTRIIPYGGFDEKNTLEMLDTAPDVALIEIFPEGLVMEGGIGNAIIRGLKQDFPETKILLWALNDEYYAGELAPEHNDVERLSVQREEGLEGIIRRINEVFEQGKTGGAVERLESRRKHAEFDGRVL